MRCVVTRKAEHDEMKMFGLPTGPVSYEAIQFGMLVLSIMLCNKIRTLLQKITYTYELATDTYLALSLSLKVWNKI